MYVVFAALHSGHQVTATLQKDAQSPHSSSTGNKQLQPQGQAQGIQSAPADDKQSGPARVCPAPLVQAPPDVAAHSRRACTRNIPRPSSARPASPHAPRQHGTFRPKSAMVISAQPPPSDDRAHVPLPPTAHAPATPQSPALNAAPLEQMSQRDGLVAARSVEKASEGFRYNVQRRSVAQVKPPFKRMRGAVDSHLPQATLHVTAIDVLDSAPVAGAAVSVIELQAFLNGSTTNCGSTQRRTSKADSRGRMKCTILGSYRCEHASLCLARQMRQAGQNRAG